MGLVLDSSILIAAERRGEYAANIIKHAANAFGEFDLALAAVSVVELTHGIYRARSPQIAQRRRLFCEQAFAEIPVQELTLEIAQLAGRIEGERAALGIVIPFQDLLIGVTALHLGFSIATHNDKHFRLIPGLPIVTI